MRIRKCRRDDIEDVIKIEAMSFKYTYPSTIFYNYLGGLFFVAEENGKIIGYAMGDARRHLVVSIAVHPDYRRRGVGKRLLEELIKNMRDYVVLQVRKSNEAAINFYKKMGFVEKELIEDYYIDGEDAILMFRKID